MTDYNDGGWHTWDGGECPVHPKSVVEYVWHHSALSTVDIRIGSPSSVAWKSLVVRFRIVTPYIEPRTMWAVGKHLHDTREDAEKMLDDMRRYNPTHGFDKWRVIKMVEVLE